MILAVSGQIAIGTAVSGALLVLWFVLRAEAPAAAEDLAEEEAERGDAPGDPRDDDDTAS